jgi:hypothetical protein
MNELLVNNGLKFMRKVTMAQIKALACYLIGGTAENLSLRARFETGTSGI